jgi:hypothetical protein
MEFVHWNPASIPSVSKLLEFFLGVAPHIHIVEIQPEYVEFANHAVPLKTNQWRAFVCYRDN